MSSVPTMPSGITNISMRSQVREPQQECAHGEEQPKEKSAEKNGVQCVVDWKHRELPVHLNEHVQIVYAVGLTALHGHALDATDLFKLRVTTHS